MLVTTTLVALQVYYCKGMSIFLALAFLVFFGFVRPDRPRQYVHG